MFVCFVVCLLFFFSGFCLFFLSRPKSPIRFAFRSIAPGEKKLKVQQLYIEIVSKECRAFVHSVHTHRLYIINAYTSDVINYEARQVSSNQSRVITSVIYNTKGKY